MSEGRNKEIVDTALPIFVLATIFILGLTTLLPFLPAILWGGILSIALTPFHDRCQALFGRSNMAATLFVTLLLFVFLIVPMVFLSRALIAFIPAMIEWIPTVGLEPPTLPDSETSDEPLKALWQTILKDLALIREHFGEELRPIAFWLIGEGRLVGAFVVEFALGVALAAILMHRSRTSGSLVQRLLGRIGGTFAQDMGLHAVRTIRTTVVGLLGSAAVQTAAATFSYFVAGLPHWPILALLTFVLAMVQVGPVLIWAPAALWLWSQDQIGMALFLVGWGIVVVGLSDNLVKTLVVSRGAELPGLLAFLGAIGGLVTWGIVGIFIGPVILAVCYRLTLEWLSADSAEDEAVTEQELPR